MEAPLRIAILSGILASLGAKYETPNFVVNAASAEFAQQVGEAAEIYRRELAIEWTGREMPRWSSKCPIHVTVGMMGAGGATTFNFERGEVFGWRMNIQGSEERVLDSVLPHEINHTIFACHFRRPLPRWADEGAASMIEHESERMRLRKLHDQVLGTSQKIPLRRLLEMKEYPQGQQQVLTLYAEGHSLADYLIGKSDKATFLTFINYAHQNGWDRALKKFYNFNRVESLEKEWDKWVLAGSPSPTLQDGELFAAVDRPEPVVRGQSPEAIAANLGEPTPRPSQPVPAPAAEEPARSVALSRSKLQLPIAVRPANRLSASRGVMPDTSSRHTLRQGME